jgi:hypothetical protein
MSPKNRIGSLRMEIRTLNPAEADVRFHVAVDRPDDRLGLKGRLVGPRCAYASTVEVAYPLSEAAPGGPNRLSTKVVIPEPNLWEPACPFLYEVTLELFRDQSRIDAITLIVGLRTVAVSGRSFVLNGKRFELKVMEAVHATESDLAPARKQFNTVVLPVSHDARPLWHACDQIGLAVLGRVKSQAAPELFANHACLVGWLIDADNGFETDSTDLRIAHVPIGFRFGNDAPAAKPSDADFVIVAPDANEHFQKWGMPVIELTPIP